MKQSRPPRQRLLSQRVFTVSGGYNPVLCGRSSSRPAHYKEWDEVQMGKAVEVCVNEGMSIRQAAFHFGVTKSTLGDRMSGRVVPCSTSGPKTYLSPEEETELVRILLRCAAIGDPKSRVTRNPGKGLARRMCDCVCDCVCVCMCILTHADHGYRYLV